MILLMSKEFNAPLIQCSVFLTIISQRSSVGSHNTSLKDKSCLELLLQGVQNIAAQMCLGHVFLDLDPE